MGFETAAFLKPFFLLLNLCVLEGRGCQKSDLYKMDKWNVTVNFKIHES